MELRTNPDLHLLIRGFNLARSEKSYSGEKVGQQEGCARLGVPLLVADCLFCFLMVVWSVCFLLFSLLVPRDNPCERKHDITATSTRKQKQNSAEIWNL